MTRHAVLLWLEKAKIKVYHYQVQALCFAGFFSFGYNLFSISTVTTLLGRLYYYNPGSGKPGILPVGVHAGVVGAALCGALFGQLFFGWAGDKWGRRKMCTVSSIITVFASLASGLSFGSTRTRLMVTLGFFRFWLGFGIGGNYPLLATMMSEYSNEMDRGFVVAFLFGCQGVGIALAETVAYSVFSIFSLVHKLPSFYVDPVRHEVDFVWRVVLMFGAILPAGLEFTSCCRKIPEAPSHPTVLMGVDWLLVTSHQGDVPTKAVTERTRFITYEKTEFLIAIEVLPQTYRTPKHFGRLCTTSALESM
ncbi:hypothetical protein R1sor_000467 [Riccia sorocarpa]|uniref:Major facilitator superfamily (MFS) profile domain-containing protein n=1 Tax=Riccia sorocarpa TaxID=122646 RepID=A0ABD3GWC1_9MARC